MDIFTVILSILVKKPEKKRKTKKNATSEFFRCGCFIDAIIWNPELPAQMLVHLEYLEADVLL